MSSMPSSSSVCSTPSAPFPRMRAVHGKSKSISRSKVSEFYVSLSSDLRLLAVQPGGTAPSSLRSFRDGEAAFCLKLKRMEDFSQDILIERVVADRVRPYSGRSVEHAVIITEGKKSVVLFTNNAEERNNWLNALRIRVAPLPVLRRHILVEIRSDNPIDGFNLSVANVSRGILDYDNPENEPKKSTARWAKRLWELFETGKKPIDCTSGLMRALAGASKEVKNLAQPFSAIAVVGSVFSIISLTASAMLLITEEREGRGKLAASQRNLYDASRALLEFFVKILKSGLQNELLVEEVFKVISESWDADVNVEQYLLQRCMKRVWEAKQIKDLEEKVEAVTKQLLVVGTLNAVAKVGEDVGEVRKDVAELKDGLTDAQKRIGKVEAEKGVVDEFIPYFPDDAKLRDGLLPEAAETTLSQLKSRVLPRPSQSDEAVSAEGISPVADNVVRRVAVASVSGEGGVGKTSACKLLCADPEVRKHFCGGAILWLPLGQGVSDAKVKKRIASIVADCGGRLTAERISEPGDVEDAVRLAREFFSSHRILLVIDNVWKRSSCSNGEEWMTVLSEIASCCGSVVVMSTRSDDLSKAPGLEHVRLGRLNLEATDSPDWKTAETLYDYHRNDRVEENSSDSYARPQKRARMDCPTEESAESNVRNRKRALKLSCGIPLAIATIGRLIRARGSGAEHVLSCIESKMGGLVSKSFAKKVKSAVGHPGLHFAMSESLKLLDESEGEDDIFRSHPVERQNVGVAQFSASYEKFSGKPVSSRYAALAAMDKSVPQFTFEVLCHLWHLKSGDEAGELAEMFVNLGLGRIERHGNSNDEAVFSVHDLQYAYCAETSCAFPVKDDSSCASVNGHLLLLSRCESTFRTSSTGARDSEVDWVSVCFSSEERRRQGILPSVPARTVSQHLGQNLFNHLLRASSVCPTQAVKEMVRLLTDFRWLRGRGARYGREGVVSDFVMAQSGFPSGGGQEQSCMSALNLLKRLAQRAPEKAYSRCEGDLAWHIVGRLQEEKLNGSYSEFEVGIFEKLIRSAEQNASESWLSARRGCFPRLSKDSRLLSEISVREGEVFDLDFPIAHLGDGAHIVCARSGGGFRIHNIHSAKLALEVDLYSDGLGEILMDNITAVDGEHEGSYYVFFSLWSTVHVRKVRTDNSGKLSVSGDYPFPAGGGIYSLSVSKSGHRVAIGHREKLTFWKREGGDESLLFEEIWRCSLPRRDYSRTLVAISPSGDFVVAAFDNELFFWKNTEGYGASELKPTTSVTAGADIFSIVLSQNTSSLLVGLETGAVEVWDIASGSRRGDIRRPDGMVQRLERKLCLCVLEDPSSATGAVAGDRLLVGVGDSVFEYCAKDLSLITTYALSSNVVSICALLSRNGEQRIVAGCEDGSMCVLNAERGDGGMAGAFDANGGGGFVAENRGDYVSSVAVAGKRELVLAGHKSGMLSMWNASSGAFYRFLSSDETKHSGDVECIDVSDDERIAVSGCWDGSIRVWDLKSEKLRFVLNGHSNFVREVKCSGNRRIVSSDCEGEVKIWKADEGGQALNVIPFRLYSLSPELFVSQDGKYCIAILTGAFEKICDLIALEDGQIIVSLMVDKSIKFTEIAEKFATLYSIDIHPLRPCLSREGVYVKLFLYSGITWEASREHNGFVLVQRTANEETSIEIEDFIKCRIVSIAAGLTSTETGSPQRVIVACRLRKREAPVILHYMFRK